MTKMTPFQMPIAVEIRGKFNKKIVGTASPYRGIYQMRRCKEGYIPIKMKFYAPANPQTEPQQLNRAKYAAAVLAWQGLTTEQKKSYNVKVGRRHCSGYNIFIKEYMLS